MYNDAQELFDIIKGRRTASTARTSSFGPKELEAYHQAVKDEEAAKRRPIPDLPRQPKLSLPFIESHYEMMGEALGMCPYEIEALTETALNEVNPMVVDAFRKFIMVAKLANSDPVNVVRKDISARHETYNNQVDAYDKQVSDRNYALLMADELTKAAREGQLKAWVEMLIKLQTTLQRSNKVESLGDWDRWLIKAIHEVAPRTAVINSKSDEAKLVFESAKKFDLEKIATVLKSINSIKERERRDAEHKWLWSAPLEELSDVLWRTDNQSLRSDIEAVMLQRQGYRPSIDKYGKLDSYGRAWQRDWDDYDTEYEHLKRLAALTGRKARY